jgi:hypothetical protein
MKKSTARAAAAKSSADEDEPSSDDNGSSHPRTSEQSKIAVRRAKNRQVGLSVRLVRL